MASVWGELKRRNVVKVAVAYAIVGWLLIEVTSTVFPLVQLPDWTATLVTMLLLLGFPIALILSWAYELTPDGMKKSHEVQATESIAHVTGRRIDFAIIGALVLALGFVVYNYVLEDGSEVMAGVLPNSVAVLPFENLSPDPDNAYFAAGLHEEILSQLAKLRNLSVISRTSVLRFAEADMSIPDIARELNVGTVMEGSVRYANERVRITMQLIDANTDEHLWSETYDREFADIFAIESDIAMNVANALEAEFSLEEQESIERAPTESSPAYAAYLRAQSKEWPNSSVVADLDEAIELDSGFALAYALKAYYLAYFAALQEVESAIIENAETALSLDQSIAMAHLALGVLHENRWEGAEARRAFERAYELGSNDPAVLEEYARFKRNYTGEYAEAIRANERAAQLDPNTPLQQQQLGISYQRAGRYEDAAEAFRRAISLGPESLSTHVQLADLEAARGRRENALRELENAEELVSARTWHVRFFQMAVIYGRINRRDEARRLFGELEAREQEGEPISDAVWAIAYLAVGEPEEARQRLANTINYQVPDGIFSYDDLRIPLSALKWNIYHYPELDTPEFQELRDRIFPLD